MSLFMWNQYLASLWETFGLLEFKIWWIKKISLVVYWENTHQYLAMFKVILKCKIDLKESKAQFMQNGCLVLLKYWHIFFHLLWKMFQIYCRVWNFFETIKEALKQVWVTLCRIDVLHHCYRFLVRLNSIFDELK